MSVRPADPRTPCLLHADEKQRRQHDDPDRVADPALECGRGEFAPREDARHSVRRHEAKRDEAGRTCRNGDEQRDVACALQTRLDREAPAQHRSGSGVPVALASAPAMLAAGGTHTSGMSWLDKTAAAKATGV